MRSVVAAVLGSAQSPQKILGSLLHADFDAADPGIQLNGGTVASIPNRGQDSAAMVQATASKQPVYSATSFANGPGMTFDGLDDNMLCTFTSAIPSGRRPYVWVVFKANNTNQTFQCVANLGGTQPQPALLFYQARGDYLNFTGQLDPGGGPAAAAFLAATESTRTHLGECGYTVGGTNATSLDGVSINISATSSAPLNGAAVKLRIAAYGNTDNYWAGCTIRRVIVTNDLPSQAQIDAMRAYLRAQPYGLPSQTPPLDPLMIDYWHSELGVTLNSGVDSWKGQLLGLNVPFIGARPAYGPDGANFNGRNVVRCTPTTALFTTGQTPFVTVGSRPYMVSVFRLRATPSAAYLGIFSIGASGNPDTLYFRALDPNFMVAAGGGAMNVRTPLDVQVHRWEAWADGTNLNSRLDGALVSQANAISASALGTGVGIGCNYQQAHRADVSHAFHAIFSAKPSDAYLTQLLAWAESYWGITPTRPPLPTSAVEYWHSELECTAASWKGQILGRVINATGTPVVGVDGSFFNGRRVAQASDAPVAHWLSNSSGTYAAGAFPWIMTIGRLRATNPTMRLMNSVGTYASVAHYAIEQRNTDKFGLTANSGATIVYGPSLDTAQHNFKCWSDGTNLSFKVDGAATATTPFTTAAPANSTATSIGGSMASSSNCSSMSTAFFLVCSSKPSDAEIAALDAWALAYWGG